MTTQSVHLDALQRRPRHGPASSLAPAFDALRHRNTGRLPTRDRRWNTESVGRGTREVRLWTLCPTADFLQPARRPSRIRQEMTARCFCWLLWSSAAWRWSTRLRLQEEAGSSRELCANAGYSFTTRNELPMTRQYRTCRQSSRSGFAPGRRGVAHCTSFLLLAHSLPRLQARDRSRRIFGSFFEDASCPDAQWLKCWSGTGGT